MTVVERIARALAKETISEWDYIERGGADVKTLVDQGWQAWVPDAIAALEALKEPGDLMHDVGEYVFEGRRVPQTITTGEPASFEIFKAMIQAAINEHKEQG